MNVAVTPTWRKPGWWLEQAAILLAACCIALMAVNVVDWWQFRRAVTVGERVSPEQWRQIIAVCRRLQVKGEYAGRWYELPAEIRRLGAANLGSYGNSAQISLYSSGYLYAFLSLDLGEHEQRVVLCQNDAGEQSRETLWYDNAQTEEQMHPQNRIVTVSMWGMHGGIEWIVLPTALRVITRDSTTDHADNRILEVALAPAEVGRLAVLCTLLRKQLPPGRYYNEGMVDGLALTIAFDQGRDRRATGVEIENIWLSELKPLLDAINERLPEKLRITFERSIFSMESDGAAIHPKSMSWEEWNYLQIPPVPKWCLWRRQSPLARQAFFERMLSEAP